MKELEKKVTRKRQLIAKHNAELAELLKTCTHEGYLEEVSRYSPGSYNDTAYTTYWTRCKLCSWYGNERTKEHSWYG